jgi:predicted PurR-regulated permease PerM
VAGVGALAEAGQDGNVAEHSIGRLELVNVANWSLRQRARAIITLILALVALMVLYVARAALLPFMLGLLLAYVMLPFINWLDLRLQFVIHRPRLTRTLAVLIGYVLVIVILAGSLAFVIPPIATQVSRLTQGLPDLVRRAYSAAPEVVQLWLDRYNEAVPEEIRLALERSIQDRLQALIEALQAGLFRTIGVLFSTVSFVLGLVIVPLWMFYILRDQPEMDASLYRLIPRAYHEDVRSIRALIDEVLSGYLRGQLILVVLVALMFFIGLELIGIDFALLLGTIVGLLEVIPVLGPILGAIPALVVTLATAPSKVWLVVLLAIAVQQIENNFFVPHIAGGTVRLHPAIVMIALVIGGAVAGAVGLVLSVPLTAIIRDVAHYLYLRFADEPLSPQEAAARVRNRF